MYIREFVLQNSPDVGLKELALVDSVFPLLVHSASEVMLSRVCGADGRHHFGQPFDGLQYIAETFVDLCRRQYFIMIFVFGTI
jgi:hypothetical protein